MSEQKIFVASMTVASVDELFPALEAASDREAWHMLWSDLEVGGIRRGLPDRDSVKSYSHGRLFSRKAEVRWQCSSRGVSVLFIGDAAPPGGFSTLAGAWTVRNLQTRGLAVGQRGQRHAGERGTAGAEGTPEQSGDGLIFNVQELFSQESGRVEYTRLVAIGGRK